MTGSHPLSRRAFLKLAGGAATAVATGAGFGGLLAACDDSGDTSHTVATIGDEETTSTLTPTTVTTRPEAGRYLRVGVVSAKTGDLALFGRADEWWLKRAAAVLPDGVLCRDGRAHKLIFLVQDSGSDPARAAEAAVRLVSDGGADILFCSGGTEVVIPVADQAEALGCPCLSSFVHWQPFVFGRGATLDTPFKWTYAHAIGLEDVAANYLAMWGQIATNKKVGFVHSDDAAGRMWTDGSFGVPAAAADAGYEPHLPGSFTVGTGDFSTLISEFVASGCEICCGAMPVADLIAFRQQAEQMGFRPKIVTMSKALLFPLAVEAIGPQAADLTTEGLWLPDWPYTDSLTGDSAQQLAGDFMIETGEQWVAPIAQYARLEWAVDAFRRVSDIDDRDKMIEAVRTTRLSTCLGAIDFMAPVGGVDAASARRPTENVYKAPVVGIQWIPGGTFVFQPVTVTNANHPGLPTTGRVQPIAYKT